MKACCLLGLRRDGTRERDLIFPRKLSAGIFRHLFAREAIRLLFITYFVPANLC